MNILLKKNYKRRKKGEIVTVTNEKGKEMIEAGTGTLTKLAAYDDKPKAAAAPQKTNKKKPQTGGK